MSVILVNKVGSPKKNNWKKWRAEEEERHKGLLTQKRLPPYRVVAWRDSQDP
jgi:hypothetical protein